METVRWQYEENGNGIWRQLGGSVKRCEWNMEGGGEVQRME